MASKNIRGITVEIGGDTSELTAELKKLDKSAKSSSDELREINAALKNGDPQNVTMLAQKHDALTQSIATAKDKVDLLREAEKQAAEQVKNGEIGEEQYRALQREVVYAENKLKKLENELKDCEKAQEKAADAAKDEGKAVKSAGDEAQDAAEKQKDLEKSLDELKNKYSDAKGAAQDAAKEFATSVTAISGAATGALVVAMGYEDALDSIRLLTGASENQMVLYEGVLEDVFSSGLGEDIDDVAASMAKIIQMTGETDPDKLKELTENALVLKDSFDFEVDEQLRAVNALMSQFGVSAEEAYNLIVQGVQAGLNQNGDLLDVINEYSVHYKQLGYDADDFFNSLVSGAATGVFSVDKLGDAMKEFGVRVKDTGSSTTDALASLGFVSQAELEELRATRAELEESFASATTETKKAEIQAQLDETATQIAEIENALNSGCVSIETLQAAFTAGGDEAQDAMGAVLDALWGIDDQVAQNEVGVGLFGTMWEDLGVTAIKALRDVDGSLSMTKAAMEDVKEVNLSSTSSKWASLGRTVQTELFIPLGEKLLPLAKKVVNYVSDNAGTIAAKLKQIAIVMASMWVASKIGSMVSAISKAVVAYKQLKAATTAANAAMATTPWGAVGAAVGAVVGGIISFISAENDAADAAKELREELDAQTKSYWETANAARDAASERRTSLRTINEEHEAYEELWEKLTLIVDENGNVTEGNEDLAESITKELSEALGLEIELTGNQISNYRQLQSEIYGTIAANRLSATMSKMQGDYDDAVDNLEDYQMNSEQANATWQEYLQKKERLAELDAWHADLAAMTDEELNAYMNENYEEMAALTEERRGLQKWLSNNSNAKENYEAARYTYDQALWVIAAYEGLEEAYYSGDETARRAALDFAAQGIVSTETGAGMSTIERQAVEAIVAQAELVDMSGHTGTTVTQEQIDAAAATTQAAIEALFDAAEQSGEVYDMNDLAAAVSEYLAGADLTDAANDFISQYTGNADDLLVMAGFKTGNIADLVPTVPTMFGSVRATSRTSVDPVFELAQNRSTNKNLRSPALDPTRDAMLYETAASSAGAADELNSVLSDSAALEEVSGTIEGSTAEIVDEFLQTHQLLAKISQQVSDFEIVATIGGDGWGSLVDSALGNVIVRRSRGGLSG